jgi:hypothetical protein
VKQLQKTSARSVNAKGIGARKAESLHALYERDETAWLEVMADLVSQRRYAQMDHRHLSEYLNDLAKRDRREVKSRLVQLLLHLLKWEHQPENRTTFWENTIDEQRLERQLLLESATLHNHAVAILNEACAMARKHAAKQTKLKISRFPKECPWNVDELLTMVDLMREGTA